MPRIQANRDTIDDRFSVLGFTVRTESPLFEVAVATDPGLFKAENRGRRAHSNFYSSRAQGVTRARRGEAVYLVPPDVLNNFVGQPRLYFGLATYRENSRGAPDYVQAPTDGSMYVGMGQLTERGLRRSAASQGSSSYGGGNGGRDTSLDWGGDAARAAGPAAPAPVTAPGAARTATAATAAKAAAPEVAVAAGYDDGFGAFPETERQGDDAVQSAGPPLAHAQEVLLRSYDGDLASQIRLFAETVAWIAGVSDTSRLPHSAICHLLIYNGETLRGRATAFFIGRNLLMTNAHVVTGSTRLVVIPGKNGAGTGTAQEPFGRFSVDLTPATSRPHPSFNGGRDFDMAIVKTAHAAPNGHWLAPVEELRQSRPEGVAVCGYSAHSRRGDLVATIVHATLDPEKQHVHRGYVRTITDDSFTYDVQELAGSSGSPVYWIEGGANPHVHVVGINAGPRDDTTNEGCRLTDAKLAWIRGIAKEWGQASAMEVEDAELARGVGALAIPLDPGAGGRSIGTSALHAGDIVVSTTRQFASRIIRLGTLSPVSHVMLYVGDGKVIEAVGSGVRETTLAGAIDDSILAVAYRHPQLDATRAAAVVAYARSRVGNPYNYAGVAFQGYRILNPLPASVIEVIGRRLGVEVGQAGAVYCSELVLESFERAGAPLNSSRPAQSTPEQVVQIARSNLSYVGHLKAEDVPLGIQLGLADAFDTPVGETFSVHWSDVPLYAQTSQASCWAAAAAMIVSWRDQVSISDESIARHVPVVDAYKRGLFPSERRPLADAWNLVPEPPASYTIQRWRQMLAQSGPLYIDMNWSPGSGGHARVLVGMTSSGATDGSDTMMYMHDPWPGTAGHIKLPFGEFLKLYEGRVGNSGGNLQYQILHAGAVPAGRRTVTAAPFALTLANEAEPPEACDGQLAEAQAAKDYIGNRADDPAQREATLPPPPPAVIQQPLALSAPVAETQAAPLLIPIAAAVIGAVFTRLLSNSGDVSWELDQMSGLKHPNDQAPAPVPAFHDAPAIRLTDWPSTGGLGTISAGFEVRWQYDGRSLGNVQINNVASSDAALWGLVVKARIMNDSIVYPSSNPQFAALRVRLEYRFTHTVFSDRLAYREIHLFGDGTYNMTGDWTQNTFF